MDDASWDAEIPLVFDCISGFSSGVAATGAGDQYFSGFCTGFCGCDGDGAGWKNDLAGVFPDAGFHRLDCGCRDSGRAINIVCERVGQQFLGVEF